MNTGIISAVILFAIMVLLLIALRRMDFPIKERPFSIFPVEFLEGFDDGSNVFFKGEHAWVIDIVDENYVLVSNKHDGYCASDGCEPFKICTVPISILRSIEETNQQNT